MSTPQQNSIRRSTWEQLNRLNSLMDYYSPLSCFFAAITTYGTAFLLLRPSWKEALWVQGLDVALILILRPAEMAFFEWRYPDVKSYFRKIDWSKIQNLNTQEQKSLIHSFMNYPKRRAAHCYQFTFIKNFPLLLLITFYWNHSVSNGLQFCLILGISLITEAYFYGTVYLETHFCLSELLQSLHEKFDFSHAFQKIDLQYSKRELEFHDALVLSVIIFFMLALQSTIALSQASFTPTGLAIRVTAVGIAGLILFGHLWFLGRKLLVGNLERLFKQMQFMEVWDEQNVIPLTTSPLVAQFEKTFNYLVFRLKSREQELASLVFKEAEKSRYRVLGEISALIAHDLSGPLHIAQYCADQLSENWNNESKSKVYVDQINQSLDRAIELSTSLKARLKNTPESSESCFFGEVHARVVRILETTYGGGIFDCAQIQTDPLVLGLNLSINRVELSQILDNIYRNCIENFLRHPVADPTIKVQLISEIGDNAMFAIVDNGSGLKSADFERLTAFGFVQNWRPIESTGLGLRLTRRLIEHRGGTLEVLDQSYGTHFRIRMKSRGTGLMKVWPHSNNEETGKTGSETA